MAGKIVGQVKDLKKGRYVIIDGTPCRVVDVQISKPGKHGAAKARVTAISLVGEQKKTLMKPVDANCEIPIVDKRKGQVIADMGSKIQIMDLETYETFEIDKPSDISLEAGQEVEYMEVMGMKLITRGK
ncbi:MAG: translation initiation factor IF-5A [Candidatus Diapherotrites archaeon]|nr:translation initiation factor IF-5A [Candidatus Diapherotrites archaeon]